MLNQNTRANINERIEDLNSVKRRLYKHIHGESDLTANQWHNRWEKLIDTMDDTIIELESYVDQIWCNNQCRSVQASLNYYLRKAKLPTKKITAIF